jgi:hypothetical protein
MVSWPLTEDERTRNRMSVTHRARLESGAIQPAYSGQHRRGVTTMMEFHPVVIARSAARHAGSARTGCPSGPGLETCDAPRVTLLPGAGIEPARGFPQRILRRTPARTLPALRGSYHAFAMVYSRCGVVDLTRSAGVGQPEHGENTESRPVRSWAANPPTPPRGALATPPPNPPTANQHHQTQYHNQSTAIL